MKQSITRKRILDEAETQFIKNGIASTQMKDIALSIDINRRTLYRYFPTKDELAFEVEMIVMKQIQAYMTFEPTNASIQNCFDKVTCYFERIDLNEIKDQLKFTAEFDRYFQDDYPNKQLEEKFIQAIDPKIDPLYRYIEEGINDGSIRDNLSSDDLFHFISQSFFALFQRLLLREKHLKHEYCENVDFQVLFKEVILKGIKNTTATETML